MWAAGKTEIYIVSINTLYIKYIQTDKKIKEREMADPSYD